MEIKATLRFRHSDGKERERRSNGLIRWERGSRSDEEGAKDVGNIAEKVIEVAKKFGRCRKTFDRLLL